MGTLSNRFSIKDLHSIHYFLGTKVVPTSTSLFLSYNKYIRHLLEHFHMTNAKVVTMPISTTNTLMLHDGIPLANAFKYMRVVGMLQRLPLTLPHIT